MSEPFRTGAGIEKAVLLKVCDAYGGNPDDPVWHTPEGVASLIEDLSGQARINFLWGWNAACEKLNGPEDA